MCLWAFALDIAHATRMKIDSVMSRLCRGVTAVGVPVRGAFQDASERVQSAAVRPVCQTHRNGMVRFSRIVDPVLATRSGWENRGAVILLVKHICIRRPSTGRC